MHCRACDSPGLMSIIPLGEIPLANALLREVRAKSEPRYNLEVMLCPKCGLAQLKDLVDPQHLFSDYVYFSSNSETMLHSAAQCVERIIPTLPSNALIIEIASNDGYLLKNYVTNKIAVLGIDPAQNIAKVANEKGIPTLCEFFNENLANKLMAQGKQADVIHANNVMAHVPDIKGFIKGLKILLKPSGIAVIEVPYFADLVEKLEFDTIYHEHVYYFSVKPLAAAFKSAGLELYNLEKLNIHGGTLRLFVGHQGAHQVQPILAQMIQHEEKSGLYDHRSYAHFMSKLATLKHQLVNLLLQLKKEGKKIAAYGASAKGTTLLNFFGVSGALIDFVVDRSQTKQGQFTPGTHLLIRHPQALIDDKMDYALLLVWNFVDEILAQQSAFTQNAGKFIIPLPTVEIIA
ncbi:MAG: class I SAM-dependent methyltransferase [Candidatus Berkiellales bacterium]